MTSRRGGAAGLAAVAVGLLVVVVGLFWRAVFQARVLGPADAIFTTPFFAPLAPPGFTRPGNPLLFDQVYQFIPWRHFTRESLRHGIVPLWNPHSLAGSPFLATMQSAVLYPINLFLLAVPFERTFVWSAILRLWIAGMLTFLLARRSGLSILAALVAGVAFMLCGFLSAWLGHPHTNVAVWLPGLILAGEMILEPRPPGGARYGAGLLALLVAVQFTGGHIETSVDILFGFAVYVLVRWRQLRPAPSAPGGKLGPLSLLVAGLVLGTALAAVQLLPFLEWLPLSKEAHDRAVGASFTLFDADVWKYLLQLPLFVFPNVFNNPTWDLPYFNFLPWGKNYNADVLYVGVLPLLLAVVALVRNWRSSGPVRAWSLVGLLAFGRAFHLPILDWINSLPGFSLEKPNMLRLLGSFSVCMLAGFGTQAVLTPGEQGNRARALWLWLCGAVVVCTFALAILGKVILPRHRDRLVALDRQQAVAFHESVGDEPQPPEYLTREAERMATNTVRAFRLRNTVMYAPGLFATAALLLGWLARGDLDRRRRRLFGATLLLLVVGDLLWYDAGYNPTVSVESFYPKPTITATLARDSSLFRFTATQRDLTADAQMMFAQSDIRGLDFPTAWFSAYARLAPEWVAWRKITFAGYDSPLLRVLNLKYIFARADRTPLAAELVAGVTSAGGGRLWELKSPQPRSFMVYEAQAVRNDEEAKRLLHDQPATVFSRVLLADANSAPTLAAAQSSDTSTGAQVTVVEYGPSRSAWRVYTPRDGYLFTSDAYYPGWTADLDGRPTRLFRANLAFRAIYVPAGDHLVTYRFVPRSVRIGVIISCLALLGIGLLIRFPRRHRSTQPLDAVSA